MSAKPRCKAKCGRSAAILAPMGDGAVSVCYPCAHQMSDHGVPLARASEASCSCPPEGGKIERDRIFAEALPHLRKVALRLTRDASDADDILQDALVRACVAWERFRGANPRGWLSVIVRNCFLNECRRRKIRGFEGTSNDPQIVPDPGACVDAIRGLKRLRAEHRAVIELSALGESYQEIAKELRLPIGTVMSRLHRARKALAEVCA